MNEKAQALLEAQVAYALSQFNEAGIKTTLETELQALEQWLEEVQFEQVFSKQRLLEIVHDFLLKTERNNEVIKLIKTEAIYYVFAPWLKQHLITDFFTREDYDAVTNKLIEMEDIRNEILHHSLHSPVYKQFIADISYHVIKQYITEENIVAKKVPGVSSLMKMGNKAMNLAAPKFEAALENTVKNYIKDNLDSTIGMSEKLLIDSLDEETLKDLSSNLFEAMQNTRLDLADRYLEEDDLHDLVDLIAKGWEGLREKESLHQVLDKVIDRVYDTAEKNSLGEWYRFFGLNNEDLTIQLSKTIAEGIKPALETGYLEQRLREIFTPFYQSTEATEILAPDKS